MTVETTSAAKESTSETEESTSTTENSTSSRHWIQNFYDNPWILLALGILIPFISYTLWGWVELSMITPAELP